MVRCKFQWRPRRATPQVRQLGIRRRNWRAAVVDGQRRRGEEENKRKTRGEGREMKESTDKLQADERRGERRETRDYRAVMEGRRRTRRGQEEGKSLAWTERRGGRQASTRLRTKERGETAREWNGEGARVRMVCFGRHDDGFRSNCRWSRRELGRRGCT